MRRKLDGESRKPKQLERTRNKVRKQHTVLAHTESTSSLLSDFLFDDTDEFLSFVPADRCFPQSFSLSVKVKANGDVTTRHSSGRPSARLRMQQCLLFLELWLKTQTSARGVRADHLVCCGSVLAVKKRATDRE